jgi:hypothetical protein
VCSSDLFTVPQGQSVPGLTGSTATAQAHQTKYTELTTNLSKAGELGAAIGDAAVRGIGITIETAPLSTAGAYSTYGATPGDVQEILNKCWFQFKIGGKTQIQAPVWGFPAYGGATGSIMATANAFGGGVAHNGSLVAGGKRLKVPLQLGRQDTLEGVFGVAGSATLVFSTTTGYGSPTLVTIFCDALVRGDVR